MVMKKLLSIIEEEGGEVTLQIKATDLLQFSIDLLDRYKRQLGAVPAPKEQYMSKEEVKIMCGVCDATLWHWNKKGYLKAYKAGTKVRYKMSDVVRFIEGRKGMAAN
jgi:hypothetical protein